MIDVKTNQILGVNWGGIELRFKNRTETFNAATSSSYVRAFLANDTDDLQAKAKNKSDAAGKSQDKEESDGNQNMNAKAACGTINNGTSQASFATILMILFLPLALVLLKIQ